MDKNKNDFSVVVLAAGNSTRMGVPKFSLEYSAKSTFLEHIIKIFDETGCKEIIVVVNNNGAKQIKENTYAFPENVKITINKHPEWDRFYSVKTGLQKLSQIQPTFIVNVDNPFVNIKVNQALLNSIDEADSVYPVFNNKGGHPVLLSEKIVKEIINNDATQLHFREYLKKYSKKKVEVDDENCLININTQEEYQHFFR